jgi:phosphoribosylformylglycinamidine cyclo-ligase
MDPYSKAGVSLEEGARAVELIKAVAARATRPEVKGGLGGFAGLFEISPGRYLVAGTDGVGTKCELARQVGRLDTVGIDLVAMCVNDIACVGAEPLMFLDYISVGRVDAEAVASLVKGVATGCEIAGAALLGGETAEHPGVMEPDEFDIAGFCVVGLASSGLHSNGFSLVRKALIDDGDFASDDQPEGLERPLIDELLEPTRIYSPLLLDLGESGLLHAAAHITGGGFYENVPRALPSGLGAEIDTSSWEVPAIFGLVERAAGAKRDEMFHILNMGIGMVLVTSRDVADQVIGIANGAGYPALRIGAVTAGSGVRLR